MIGGFDSQFRTAGDDVDVCWRLRDRGWTLGFSPAAMVWHHRRNRVRAYVRQQQGYGEAEALLERKWPDKYNGAGHLTWLGRVYGNGGKPFLWGGRLYHGVWGGAPFQSLYQPAPGAVASFLRMPEWYLVIAALAVVSSLGLLWRPLLHGLPLLSVAVLALIAQAGLLAGRARFVEPSASRYAAFRRYGLTLVLHLLQPLARLRGRLSRGLTPWRRTTRHGFSLPRPRQWAVFTSNWKEPEQRLMSIESALRARGIAAERGGCYDRWDLEVRGGVLGAARLIMAVEDHGAGTQYIRIRSWPRCAGPAAGWTLFLAGLAATAALDGAWVVSAAVGSVCALLAVRVLQDCSAATSAMIDAVKSAGMSAADDRSSMLRLFSDEATSR